MKRLILAIAALTLLLASCDLRAELHVNGNGSGIFGFAFLIDQALLDRLPGAEADPAAEFGRQFADSPVPFTVEEISEGGSAGVRASFAFSSPDDLNTKLNALAASEGQAPGAFGDDFRLERDGDGWVFEATGESVGDEFASGFNEGFDQAAPEGGFGSDDPFSADFNPEMLAGLFDFSFRVTLPGTAGSHNATRTIDGGGATTYVWDVDLTSTDPLRMSARSVGAGGGFPAVPVGVGVLLVGAGIIAAAKLRRPRTGSPVPVLEGFGPPPSVHDDEEIVG